MIDEKIKEYCKNYKGIYKIDYFLDGSELAIILDSVEPSKIFHRLRLS